MSILDSPLLDQTFEQVLNLHNEIARYEKAMQAVFDDLHPQHRDSARNLLHYLAFRCHDVRDVQGKLSSLGLSSLGRSEACILTALQQVLSILSRLTRKTLPATAAVPPLVSWEEGKAILARNTVALFGPDPAGRHVRIMITMSTEAAHSYEHVRALVQNGMDCMRINCAHDNIGTWKKMIDHLHRARKELQKPCSIVMDLSGPKLRTGRIAPGPAIHKWRPTRDAWGRVTRPVRVLLQETTEWLPLPAGADFQISIPHLWLKTLRRKDQITFKDARDAKRRLDIVELGEDHAWAECRQTAYLAPGLKLRLLRKAGKKWQNLDRARLRYVPPTEQTLSLRPGERLLLTGDGEAGRPAIRDERGNPLESARIGCTLPAVFADLEVDQHVWFDDGKIGGRIVRVAGDYVEIDITHALPGGSKLGPDKGINLPDSRLRLPALTAKDLEDLKFIVAHADLVGYSFVRTPQDVTHLQQHLHDLGGESLGIILKIETRHAFEQLPHLLLAAMRGPRAGVMIARGDLAIECGFERLAELQEEMLWFCEAAHLPVIWATQVLERLTKDGIQSRAEITDAAMGERAECVMLNKGEHVVQAAQTLDDILRRMAAHQVKKRSLLRPLTVADRFHG
jgi:pyruvate kinase